MPLDWQSLISTMTWVQQLTFLAARWDSVDTEQTRTRLLGMRRKSYNDELGIQAAHVGCSGMVGRLSNGSILSQLNDDSEKDAASITNTYNYYLGIEILRAGQANPFGNRTYYAKAVREWEPTYWAYKDPQIEITTEKSARAMAMDDFYRYNGGAFGTAKLEPRSAVCPVCAGWIARGIVPLRVALNSPPPYHISCPHYWQTNPDKVAKEECVNLWMGS